MARELTTREKREYKAATENATQIEMFGNVWGYCRISRRTQNIERQVRNITAAYPAAHIVKEAYTGTKIEGRKELDKLLKVVKPNDTIVFDSASRMSRNEAEAIELYEKLFNNNINLANVLLNVNKSFPGIHGGGHHNSIGFNSSYSKEFTFNLFIEELDKYS